MVKAVSAPLKLVVLIMTITGAIPQAGWCAQPYQYSALKYRNPEPAYDFTLQDQNEKPLSLHELHGKLVLIDFGFTRCANVCPTTLANLATISELLSSADRAHLQVLFISLDPTRDTPKVLKEYVPFFDARFLGLTGAPDAIATSARAFAVAYERQTQAIGIQLNDDTIEHSAAVYLVSPSGKSIGYYGSRQLQNRQRVADDLRHFLSLSDKDWDNWQTEETKVAKIAPRSGSEIYREQCASCHLENGRGIPKKYPSLIGSKWVLGAPNRLTTLILNGVKDETNAKLSYARVMPAWRTVLTSADIASILTYIRSAWGNDSPPISARYVNNLTHESADRLKFWSWRELEALPADSSASASGF